MRTQRRVFECLDQRIVLHGHPDGEMLDPDVTGDGLVDIFDVALVSRQWHTSGPLGDANFDGTVGIFDVAEVSNHFNAPPPHANDPAMRTEHLALLGTFSREQATDIAIQSGAWSDPHTWQDGTPPTLGDRVWIPANRAVVVDGVFADRVNWVRVDGELDFSSDRSTLLTVETLMGSATSRLVVDTPAGLETKVVFVDNGPIDTTWDAYAFSRGLVWHGSAILRGADKASFAFATGALEAGQQSFAVDDARGWTIGDKLVFAGDAITQVKYVGPVHTAQDDVRTILAIDGNLVTLDAPLAFAHGLVDGNLPVVQNLTRNVVLASETPGPQTGGHVMFMHNPNVEISYVAFQGLGRTDKLVVNTDPNGQGGGLENPRGRYALHIHRSGLAAPVFVTGIAIDGSPGWGLANHESFVNVRDSVSYNIVGAHFINETGNELGEFVNNVAVRSVGAHNPGQANNDRGAHDEGHTGHGFWVNGGGILVEGNIAVGHTGAAFFLNRGLTPQQSKAFVVRDNLAWGGPAAMTVWALANNTNWSEWSVIENNTLVGALFQGYSGEIVYRNNRILADGVATTGISHTGVNFDVRFIDNTVVGFSVGMWLNSERKGLVQGGFYDNLNVNMLVHNTQQNRAREITIENPSFGTRAKYNIEMSPTFFSYNIARAYTDGSNGVEYKYGAPPDWRRLFTQTSLGAASTVKYNGDYLYFDIQGPEFDLASVSRWTSDLFQTDDGDYRKTADLWSEFGLAIGNVVVPSDAQKVDGIRGWVASAPATVLTELQTLSPTATPSLSGFVARVRDTSGTEYSSEPVNLQGSHWNVVKVNVAGVERGVLVYGIDIASVLAHMGTKALEGDANRDGIVDIFDLAAVNRQAA